MTHVWCAATHVWCQATHVWCEALLKLGGDEQRGDAEKLEVVERQTLTLEEVIDQRHRHVQRVLLQVQVMLKHVISATVTCSVSCSRFR